MVEAPLIFEHEHAVALAIAASDAIAGALRTALDERGKASLMLSGGSSPKPIYKRLAQARLPWDGVVISLVDERWVAPGEAGSNADFIKACFADSPAERAQFIPLYNGHVDASAGLEAAEQALALAPQPFDFVVLGMGADAHTASWFPQAAGLTEALDPASSKVLCAVDASGCPVAGVHTDRVTLTYASVAKARNGILLLPTADKKAVFEASADQAPTDAPVNALRRLGKSLHVHTVRTQ